MHRSAIRVSKVARKPSCGSISGFLVAAMLMVGLAVPARAGDMDLEWDAVPDADVVGYNVHVGASLGASDMGIFFVSGRGTTTWSTRQDPDNPILLPDCTELFVVVKALDAGGQESVGFANFVQGLPQPFVSDSTPANLSQGEEDVLVTVQGGNFSSGMQRTDVQFDDQDIRVLSLDYISCAEIELHLSVGPFLSAPGDPGYNGAGDTVEEVPPAEIGSRGALLTAPGVQGDVIQGDTPSSLRIDFVPQRTDVDSSGRVDGFDLALLARRFGSAFGGTEYRPELDLDGNKNVDGIDQSLLAEYFATVF